MKTEYRILWIDNEHRSVRGDKRSIKSFLNDHGITLNINEIEVTPDHCPTKESSFSEAVDDIELDMVFIDFNMPEQGDKIIQHIRKGLSHYHLPILFYTGDVDAELVLQKSILNVNDGEEKTSGVADGIYFCHRDHIFEKSKLILTSLLKKEARPQQGRGLLMDRVSEIESKILAAIKLYWAQVPDEKKDKVVESVLKKAEQSRDSAKTKFDDLSKMSYEEILQYYEKDYRRWDSQTRATYLYKILKQLGADKASVKVLLEFYDNNLLPDSLLSLRNEYAHKSILELIETHDNDRCVFIRTETMRQLENIDELLKASS